MNTSKLRTFIAICPPPPILAALGDLVAALARRWPQQSVRWVRPAGIHLTLRFLGEAAAEQVATLRAGLDQVAVQHAPFELHLKSLGCFPNPRRPRVIWVGLEDLEERLRELQRAVEEQVRSLGWEPEERTFRPHLTLGRVRQRQRPPEATWVRQPPGLSFRAEAIELIQSRLKPSGAEYTTLERALLGFPRSENGK